MTRFESSNSLRRGLAARFSSVRDSRMHPRVQSAMSISSSRTSRRSGAFCSNAVSRSVRFGIRRPLEPGTGVLHQGSTLRTEIMPALPTSPTRTGTAGCYRSGATTRRDVRGKAGCGDHAQHSEDTSKESEWMQSGNIRLITVQSQLLTPGQITFPDPQPMETRLGDNA